jgi:hypothetical protein
VRDDELFGKEGRARKERRKRNIALALALGGIVVLFYLMSIVQWREHFGH